MKKWNKKNLFLNLLIKDCHSPNNNWNNKSSKDKIKITPKDKDYLLFNDYYHLFDINFPYFPLLFIIYIYFKNLIYFISIDFVYIIHI